ncbi:serine O-acetyltransferase [Rapidithrix thailandica]|uniref:Serine acetyltransferase n=1 Tax=Rapidithrix thailandica TaxID=413964 RepID=A0AAW9S6G3_9BACT
MKADFIKELQKRHENTTIFPPTSTICKLITRILLIMFPEQTKRRLRSVKDLERAFRNIENQLTEILKPISEQLDDTPERVTRAFMEKLPEIYQLLQTDIVAIERGDPAAKSTYEVIRAYPGFYAIAFFRLAHGLFELNVPLLPRTITEYAHSKTGIDIHPGATIGSPFCIDHGTGIVIGETSVIGKHVKVYQGVTIGALSVSKELALTKRHPTIQDNVVIYSGATILGGETVIGHDSIIGGNVFLTKSVPPLSTVYHQPQTKVRPSEKVPLTANN